MAGLTNNTIARRFGLGLLLFALAASPVLAAEDEEEREPPPGQLALEGVESLLRALEALIEMIPQYELPELTDEGDIIIRRKRPDEVPLGGPETEETRT